MRNRFVRAAGAAVALRSVRFAFGSVVGLVIDFGVFTLLFALGVLPFTASLLSTALAITTVYFLATRYAFRAGPTWRTYTAFVIWYSTSALCVAAVVQVVGGGDSRFALLAKMCTVPFTFVANYLFGGWLFSGGAERAAALIRNWFSAGLHDEQEITLLLARPASARFRTRLSIALTGAFVLLVLPLNLAVSFQPPADRRGALLAHLLQIAFALALLGAVWFLIRFGQAVRLRSRAHRRWLSVSLAYLAVNLIVLALIYPGYWVWDEFYTLGVVKQYSVYAWQGYLTTIFYTFGLSLGPAPVVILLVQLVLIALVVGCMLVELMSHLSRPKLAWLGLIPLLAFPVLLNNQYPLRLTLYAYLLLLLVLRVGVVAVKRRRGKAFPRDFIGLCGLIAILSFWRSEGVFLLLLIPIVFVLTGMYSALKQLPLRAAGTVVLGLSMIGGTGWITSATAPGGYQATAVLNPLSTMLQTDLKSPNLDSDLQTLDTGLDLGVVRKWPAWTETPALWNGALRGGYDASTTSVLPAFLDLVAHNPGAFLDNRWRAYLASNSMQSGWLPQVQNLAVYQKSPDVANELERFGSTNFLARPVAPELKYSLERRLLLWTFDGQLTPIGQMIWNASPQLLLTLVLGAIAVVRRRWWWAFAAAVVLCNASLVFLTEPASYFMYFFPSYLAGTSLTAAAAVVILDRMLIRRATTSNSADQNRSPIMTARPSVLLAVPTYNCAPQVGRVLDAIDADLLARLDEVVVIDNRSTDGTLAAAEAAGRRLGEKFRVWRNVENFGLGGTHKIAFDSGTQRGFDYVAVVHGDDQADARELGRLIDRAERSPSAAAVLGARFLPRSRRIGYSKVRTIGNIAINAVFSIVAGRRTIDLGSGLNLFRIAELADGEYRRFDDGITFNIDLLLHYFERRAGLAYEPITWREEDQVSNARNVSVGASALRKLVRWRLGRRASGTEVRAYRSEVMA